MIRLCLPLLLSTAACIPAQEPEQPPPPPAKCNAEGLDHLIGKTRSPVVEVDAKKRSGARTVRWITPDMMVTMDYREDRLNIHLGTDGRIGSVKCG